MFHFKAESNLVLISKAHVMHHRTLIEFLMACLEDQRGRAEDSLGKEIENTMTGWADGEIQNLAYVSAFHLWERQISHIISDQSNRTLTISQKNFVQETRSTLDKIFQINFNGGIWDGLEKARILVNAYKHGEGSSLERALQRWPELFFIDQEGIDSPYLQISAATLKDLFETLINFYEALDPFTDLDFTNWTK